MLTRWWVPRGVVRAVAVFAVLLTAALAGAPGALADALKDREWFLDAAHLNAAQAWPTSTGKGVTVAVVDTTGLDRNRAELTGSVVSSGTLTAAGELRDDGGSQGQFHATWAALLIAGHPDSPDGQQGLAPGAKIISVHIPESPASVADAIRYAVDHGARVVSLSLAFDFAPTGICESVRYAQEHDVIVVASAGNDGQAFNPKKWPSSCAGSIAAAGSDQHGQAWPQSESGPQIVLAAPAVDIPLVYSDPSTLTLSGTSFCAPLIAGEAAMLISAHPDWTSGQIIRAMIASASGGGKRIDDHLGYGVIDPVAALRAARPAERSNPLLLDAPSVKETQSASNRASASNRESASQATASQSAAQSGGIPLWVWAVVAVAVVGLGVLGLVIYRAAARR
ncbi:S8 family serine peptidase [Solihabitans fulvus]|nr:S8 family serine peptidase [Solihabitans fulvus]